MRLAAALLLASVALATLLAAFSRPVAAGAPFYSDFLASFREVPGGELVVCRILLIAPYKTNFTLYASNPNSVPREVRVETGNTLLLVSTVPPHSRAEVGVIDFPRPGWALVSVSFAEPRSTTRGCGLQVSAGYAESKGWTLLFGAVLAVVLLPLLLSVSLVFGPWTREWLAWASGSLLAAGLAYYHGPPAPLAVSVDSAAFRIYYWSALRLSARIPLITTILAVVVGSMSAFYPRGSKWEYSEILTGSWGPRRIAPRVLLGGLTIALSFAAGLIALLVAGRSLQAAAGVGDLGALLVYVARDTVCVLLVSVGLASVFAGLSLLSRSPSLVMVAGLLLGVTVLSPPCTLSVGGFYYSSIEPSYYLFNLESLLGPAKWGLAGVLAGAALALIGWARR